MATKILNNVFEIDIDLTLKIIRFYLQIQHNLT